MMVESIEQELANARRNSLSAAGVGGNFEAAPNSTKTSRVITPDGTIITPLDATQALKRARQISMRATGAGENYTVIDLF